MLQRSNAFRLLSYQIHLFGLSSVRETGHPVEKPTAFYRTSFSVQNASKAILYLHDLSTSGSLACTFQVGALLSFLCMESITLTLYTFQHGDSTSVPEA